MKPLIALGLALLAAGCATSYQQNGITGGFSDMRLAPDIFRITFRGNGHTSPERAQDFALLRASELVLQNGFTCFMLMDSNDSTTPWTYTAPSTARTTTYGTANTQGTLYGNSYQGNTQLSAHSTTTYTPGQTYVFLKPSSGLIVRAFKDKPEGVATFDAAFLRDQITTRYKIKLESDSN